MRPTTFKANLLCVFFIVSVLAITFGWMTFYVHMYNVGMSIDAIGWLAMLFTLTITLAGLWAARLLQTSVKQNLQNKVFE